MARPFETREKIILRDYLALERTTLANERTLFSYIRTSLYLLVGGIALLQVEGFSHLKTLAYGALAFSILLIVTGTIRYLVLRGKIGKFYQQIKTQEEDKQGPVS